MSPRYFSGRVERWSWKENPNTSYTHRRKSRQPFISDSICNEEKKKKKIRDETHFQEAPQNGCVCILIRGFKTSNIVCQALGQTTAFITWSIRQKMWASSCWKRRTRVRPVSVPDSSFLCRTPKSASLRGSSLHERGLWLNIRLQEEQRAATSQPNWIYYIGETLTVETKEGSGFFTSARGSSWALVQRHLLPQGRRTCCRCSAASGLMSPTVCCYKCLGRPLPEILFSSTPPEDTGQKIT